MLVNLTCWGGAGTVTGANFLLEIGPSQEFGTTKKILVDCGLLQGVHGSEEENHKDFPYDPFSIDALFVTHAHIDHIGRIPKLVHDGFKGIIYSTRETKDIAELMMMDIAKISDSNARRDGTLPIYTNHDVEESLRLWQTIPYHEAKSFTDFSVELYDAGHILGSAMYKFIFPSDKSMLFTGDLGNSPSPLLRDTEVVTGLAYLLMDSVYGDRNHEGTEERDRKFKEIIHRVIKEGRTLLIPVFSLERTQIVLYELNKIFNEEGVRNVPVFLDSPLSIKVTEIYEKTSAYYKDSVREEAKHDDIFKFPKLLETVQVKDAEEINRTQGGKIILAGSGMSTGGRIVGHEAHYLPDPNATILFVGYQAAGTLGRQISEGMKTVDIHGAKINVRAEVIQIGGYSAHKDSNNLVEFVSASQDTLKKVFIAMGETASSIFLAQRLHDELGVEAIVPERGKTYKLEV
ncbi:MAG: MBL fold metallo-hydrolase [Parcubacteria group bacterium]